MGNFDEISFLVAIHITCSDSCQVLQPISGNVDSLYAPGDLAQQFGWSVGHFVSGIDRTMGRMAEWPSLDPAIVSSLKLRFHTPLHLDASFDDSASGIEMISVFFPELMDEQVRDIVAALVEWKEATARFFKRQRVEYSAELRTKLDHPVLGSVEKSFNALTRSSPALLLDAFLKRKHKRVREESGDVRAMRFDAERRKYAGLLAQVIIDAKLPVVALVETLDDPRSAWFHLFSTRRSNTLKNRFHAWRPFRAWLEINRGRTFPEGLQDALDYLHHRVADGCGRTVPESFHIVLSLLEQVGRVPEDLRISNEGIWKSHVKSYTAELSEDAPPVRVAPLYTVAMLVSLELNVMDESLPLFSRALSWIVLIMVWCSMRCDDMQAVQPHRMMLSNFGLKLRLGRTKTTGADKRQREVFAHVFRTTSLTGEDWLGCGLALWDNEPFSFKRNYMVMEPSKNWDGIKMRYMDPSVLSGCISKLLSTLKVPRRVHGGWVLNTASLLLPDGLEGRFTGHSPRNFLTSLAATLGFSKDQRAYLGRWSMGMVSSEEYVRTSRQVIFMIQKSVNQALVTGHPVEYLEDEAVGSLVDTATGAGMNPDRIRKRHTVLNDLSGKMCLGGVFPTMEIPRAEWDVLEDFIEDGKDELEARACDHAALAEKAAKDQINAKYFITVTRRTGFRRLHLLGCYVQPDNCREVIYTDDVVLDDFDTICKSCRKKMQSREKDDLVDSSSTASSSSTAPSAQGEDLESLH